MFAAVFSLMNVTDEERRRPLTVNHRCNLVVNHRPADWFSIDTSLMQIEFTCVQSDLRLHKKKPDEDRQRADFCSLSLTAALTFCFLKLIFMFPLR